MTDTADAIRVPTVEDQARFWALVEAAWERLGPEPAALRQALATRTRSRTGSTRSSPISGRPAPSCPAGS
ncbi:hypothetical protein [Micromonospora purpureochromogenes]|uniref:DUF4240 domain-containing protein n=1 Tax=Micromonospora purpureochromogenes TaxID=47872 RepID=A0ABX2RE81_9ACTN|nr:hypothetical protein [Micromonospora purpureochromogenes]NYF54810.1 hypothetical protein [Micromonospora purpureochromogenes]